MSIPRIYGIPNEMSSGGKRQRLQETGLTVPKFGTFVLFAGTTLRCQKKSPSESNQGIKNGYFVGGLKRDDEMLFGMQK